MDKIKQETPKHEAETCWNNSNKTKFRDIFQNHTIFLKTREI